MIKFDCNKLGGDKELGFYQTESIMAHYKILMGK